MGSVACATGVTDPTSANGDSDAANMVMQLSGGVADLVM